MQYYAVRIIHLPEFHNAVISSLHKREQDKPNVFLVPKLQ